MYTTNYYGKTSDITGTSYQQVLGDGKNTNITVQSDYVHPFKDKANTKLETGVRMQLRSTTSNNYTAIRPIDEEDYIPVPSATNNYKNKDNVYAAYVSVKSSIKTFGYQLGLRAESSEYKGTLTNTGETFSNKYPISLFPSIFLSQKLKK